MKIKKIMKQQQSRIDERNIENTQDNGNNGVI